MRFPRGGEVFAIGQTVSISWDYDPSKMIDSVDICFSRDGGRSFEADPLWTGPASSRSWNWVTSGVQQTNLGKIKIVYHNTLSENVGDDTHDGIFRITGLGGNGPGNREESTQDVDGIAVSRLLPPTPNPFNRTTQLQFELASPGMVTLAVYNIQGQLVAKLAHGLYGAGRHTIIWRGLDEKGRDVPSGVYFARFDTEDVSETARKLLVR